MVQAMDHEAVEGDMDQEAVEGAIDGSSDGTRSSRRRYGSGSCRRSDGWCKGAIDGTSDGSGSCRV